jgi:quercetin dioxygenase-like cupin family protein
MIRQDEDSDMKVFPEFMRNPADAIPQAFRIYGIEGWLFKGSNGSNLALWQCPKSLTTEEHAHDFDEYTLVVEGEVRITVNGETHTLRAGQELVVPQGAVHTVVCEAGTRTINAFGPRPAEK